MIITVMLNFKMAASCFAMFMQEAINALDESTILESTKDDTKSCRRKMWLFLLTELMNLLNSCGNWLLISILLIQPIATEWFQEQKWRTHNIIREHHSNHNQTIIRLSLGDYCWIIPSCIFQQYALFLRRRIVKYLICLASRREIKLHTCTRHWVSWPES